MFVKIVTGLRRMELRIAEFTHASHMQCRKKNVALKIWYYHRFKKCCFISEKKHRVECLRRRSSYISLQACT
jgi:hypothetical protein